jgi:hypothetical protein
MHRLQCINDLPTLGRVDNACAGADDPVGAMVCCVIDIIGDQLADVDRDLPGWLT